MKKFIIGLSFILTLCFTAHVLSAEIRLPRQPSGLAMPLQTGEIPMEYITENDVDEMLAARRHRRKKYRHKKYRHKRRYRHKTPRYRHHRRHYRGGCFIGTAQQEAYLGQIPQIILEIRK
jgi:hypothetical protein